MTNEELNAALVLHRKIERLRDRLEDLEATGGVKAAGSSAPVQGGQSVSQAQIAAELSQELGELRQKLTVEQIVIRRALDKAPFAELEHKLMVLRYVECRSWKAVAKCIGYEPSRTYDYHKGALEKFGVHRSPSDLQSLVKSYKM